MFNFYIYLVSYFYAPTTGIGRSYNNRNRGIDESDADRERNQIMNEFYNTELNDKLENEKPSKNIDAGISTYQALSVNSSDGLQKRSNNKKPT